MIEGGVIKLGAQASGQFLSPSERAPPSACEDDAVMLAVDDVPLDVTEKDLEEHFAAHNHRVVANSVRLDRSSIAALSLTRSAELHVADMAAAVDALVAVHLIGPKRRRMHVRLCAPPWLGVTAERALHVSGLRSAVSSEELTSHFQDYGDCTVFRFSGHGDSASPAAYTVEYQSAASAKEAVKPAARSRLIESFGRHARVAPAATPFSQRDEGRDEPGRDEPGRFDAARRAAWGALAAEQERRAQRPAQSMHPPTCTHSVQYN